MSLDNIQIPSILVQDLYKKSLVDLQIRQQTGDAKVTGKWPFLGRNEQAILLIVDEKDSAFLNDEALKFLLGILSACQLTMGDVALINYSRTPEMNYEEIGKQFSPAKIIFFGIEPAALDFPLQFPQYKLQQYNNQVYLWAPSLSVLAAEKEQKLLLWACLKTLFSLAK